MSLEQRQEDSSENSSYEKIHSGNEVFIIKLKFRNLEGRTIETYSSNFWKSKYKN